MNRRGRVMSTNVSRNKLVQALFRTFISVWLYKEISTSWRPIISTNTYLSLIFFKYVRTAKGPVRKGYNPLIHILATNKKGYNPLIPTNYCCLFFNDWKSLLSTVQLSVHALSPYSLLSTPSVSKSSPHPSFNNCLSKERMVLMEWLFKEMTSLFLLYYETDYSYLYTYTSTWPLHITCKINLVTDSCLYLS